MKLLANVIRHANNAAFVILLLAGTFAPGAARGFAAGPNLETIQATSTQAGVTAALTLIVYNYSTPSDLQVLSQAFHDGQDRGLASALSKIKAVGHCSIAGGLSYEVAFIQTVPTPTGRKITFIASRPHPVEEADPPVTAAPFDLAIGQFDLNDVDASKSTGFLYPASKLLLDQQGEFHYDLAGTPWPLANVLDSKSSTVEAVALNAGK
jgi:hypothetical protein